MKTRKANINMITPQAFIKHLVGAIKEERIADILCYLPQTVVLYLLGEFTPAPIGESLDIDNYLNAKVIDIDPLKGEYLIEYDAVTTRYFPDVESANKFAISGQYDYSESSYDKDDKYPIMGTWRRRSTTSISWDTPINNI